MTTSEAIKHLFKTLSAYKERCNSEWCDKDKEALNVLTEELEKREKGLIIELPVPIGSMIWVIDSLREPYEWKATNFNVMEVVREWGKTVFATREEAEAKLKEWKEKK